MVSIETLRYKNFKEKINIQRNYSSKNTRVVDLGDGLLMVEHYFESEPSTGQLIRQYKKSVSY